MNFSREHSNKKMILLRILLIVSVLTSFSCGGSNGNGGETNSGNNSVANSNRSTINSTNLAVNDDIAALGSQILLPVVPEEVVFLEENLNNSADKKLTAVLKYGEEDAKNLLAQIQKHRPAEAVEIGTEDWFPAELTAQTRLSGNEMLKGNAYAPNDFLQMPYANGRIIKIENSNYFILELTTN